MSEKTQDPIGSAPPVGTTTASPLPAQHGGISDSETASSSNLDDAYHVYKESAGSLDATPEETQRTLRKIDRRIVPILFFTYMLQYLDKNSINFAATFGLKEGTNIDGGQYSWLGKCSGLHFRTFFPPWGSSEEKTCSRDHFGRALQVILIV